MRFWTFSYFIALRFGEAHDVAVLRASPRRFVATAAHANVELGRAFVADVLERRHQPDYRGPPKQPLPRTKADLVEYLSPRVGDPAWDATADLVALVLEHRFALESFEGLFVFAALLEHGTRQNLAPLHHQASASPLLEQVLAHVGLQGAPLGDDGQALLAEVFRAPGRDEPRAVYADWLLDRGDVRGEFINAQLAWASTSASDLTLVNWSGLGELLRWRAPHANEKPHHQPRYRRGFLSGARITGFDGRLADRPEWATLEVIDVDGMDLSAIDRYALTSLLALGDVPPAAVSQIASCEPIRTRLLGLGVPSEATPELLDQLLALPNLVVLGTSGVPEALLDHPIFDRIELLVVSDSRWTRTAAQRDLETRVEVAPKWRWWSSMLRNYDRILDAAAERL